LSKQGLVYNGSWGSTNYLANWWVFNANMEAGVYSGSGRLFNIPDGAATTILLAEAYADCDTVGRIALLSVPYHNLGITWQGVIGPGPDPSAPLQVWPNGMPNTIRFQVQPQTLIHAQCPAGADCCNNWTAQTGHIVLNAAMADGSVKPVSGTVTTTTWSRAMVPNDGLPVGPDW
jgi:hypothetical protein